MALNALKARVLTEMGVQLVNQTPPPKSPSVPAKMPRPQPAAQHNTQPAGTLDQEPDLFRATK